MLPAIVVFIVVVDVVVSSVIVVDIVVVFFVFSIGDTLVVVFVVVFMKTVKLAREGRRRGA